MVDLARAIGKTTALDVAAAPAAAHVTLPSDVDHASLGVLAAKLRLGAAIDAELGVLATVSVAAPLAADVNHPVLAVERAVQHLFASANAVGGLLPATLLEALLPADVDHVRLGVLRAEYGDSGAVFPKRRPLHAALVAAGLAAGVDHTSFGVLGAKLRLLSLLLLLLVCESCAFGTTFVTAHQLSDVYHIILGVPGAERRFLASFDSIGRPSNAGRVAALDHPSARTFLFRPWSLGAVVCCSMCAEQMPPLIKRPHIVWNSLLSCKEGHVRNKTRTASNHLVSVRVPAFFSTVH